MYFFHKIVKFREWWKVARPHKKVLPKIRYLGRDLIYFKRKQEKVKLKIIHFKRKQKKVKLKIIYFKLKQEQVKLKIGYFKRKQKEIKLKIWEIGDSPAAKGGCWRKIRRW